MSKAGTADGVKGDDARKAPAPAGVSPKGRRRGPKPSLSLPMIAAAAAEIADDDGLDNVSMPRLARRLGVSTMALYHYAADKSALVDLMIGSAIGDQPPFRSGERELEAGSPFLGRADLGQLSSAPAGAPPPEPLRTA